MAELPGQLVHGTRLAQSPHKNSPWSTTVEAVMKLLMPIGALLMAVGMAGSAASCYGSAIFGGADAQTRTAQLSGTTRTPADESKDPSTRLLLAPLAGLTLAAGLVCVGIGIGNWRRPIPSDVRPANPWSDQPGEHGDPPKGLV
jgi:hypothetical protein